MIVFGTEIQGYIIKRKILPSVLGGVIHQEKLVEPKSTFFNFKCQ